MQPSALSTLLFQGATLLVVGLLTYLSPYQRPYNVAQLRIGSSAQEPIKAPFLFHVPKSDVELERERLDVIAAIPTILHRDPLVQERQLVQLDSVFGAMVPGKNAISSAFEPALQRDPK